MHMPERPSGGHGGGKRHQTQEPQKGADGVRGEDGKGNQTTDDAAAADDSNNETDTKLSVPSVTATNEGAAGLLQSGSVCLGCSNKGWGVCLSMINLPVVFGQEWGLLATGGRRPEGYDILKHL